MGHLITLAIVIVTVCCKGLTIAEEQEWNYEKEGYSGARALPLDKSTLIAAIINPKRNVNYRFHASEEEISTAVSKSTNNVDVASFIYELLQKNRKFSENRQEQSENKNDDNFDPKDLENSNGNDHQPNNHYLSVKYKELRENLTNSLRKFNLFGDRDSDDTLALCQQLCYHGFKNSCRKKACNKNMKRKFKKQCKSLCNMSKFLQMFGNGMQVADSLETNKDYHEEPAEEE